jgi:pantothenate kinase
MSSSLSDSRKVWVGIAGCPGSGKTTFAQELALAVADRIGSSLAVSLPMDGYHLTRSQLSAMDDPVLAFQRRGSEWTFDPQRLSPCSSLHFVMNHKKREEKEAHMTLSSVAHQYTTQ